MNIIKKIKQTLKKIIRNRQDTSKEQTSSDFEKTENNGKRKVGHHYYPKNCVVCSDITIWYEVGEIFKCPECGEWICNKHYYNHLHAHNPKDYYVRTTDETGDTFSYGNR